MTISTREMLCYYLLQETMTSFTLFRYVSCLEFYQKDEPGRGRTCNLQIRSLTRFHCATGPYIIIPYSLFLSFARRLPRLPYSYSIIGRFISSRIHPFPSEHGSKDAQSLFSTIMFTQMGTSGNLPFIIFIFNLIQIYTMTI